jgi:predicted AlkP superfamily pyrophosphatase or phosphodiesterase
VLALLLPFAADAASRPNPTSLVIVSIDGLRPDYVLEADKYSLKIPNLRRLVRDGAWAVGVKGVLPTVTHPSHTALVTGASPSRHGIIATKPFDPTGKNYSGWYAEDIKVPTLWDVAAQAGLTTGNVEWPVTAGARITWNIPQYWRAKTTDDIQLHRLLTTPGLLTELETVAGPYPPSYDWSVDADARRAVFAAALFDRKRPRLLFAYLAGLDAEEHESGPKSHQTFAALERLDALIGRLRDTAERRGPVVFAVVSDHGFRSTDKELDLNEALRSEGLLVLDERGRITDWRAAAWNNGGSAAVMLRDPKDAGVQAAVLRVLRRVQACGAVARVLTATEAEALGGYPGATFVVDLAPGYRLGSSLEEPAVRVGPVRGTHGMLPDDENMDAAFFIVGPGIAAGRALGRIDMRDVAPTLATRLGLVLPAAEGRDVLR